jgi:FkbM family methyltransferase
MGESFKKTLLKCNFNPKSILDVGANQGLWSIEMKILFPSASFFLIEGNIDLHTKLAQTGLPFTINLVSDIEENVTFYRNNDKQATGSSIFLENTKYFNQWNSYGTNVTAYPIDDIVEKNRIGPFQMMKLDVQGAELQALMGAERTMRSVEVLITEVPVMNYNQGSPSFLQIFNALDGMGYAFYDIVDTLRSSQFNRPDNFLLQFDVMWVRKSSLLWSKDCTTFPVPSYFNDENHGHSRGSRPHGNARRRKRQKKIEEELAEQNAAI